MKNSIRLLFLSGILLNSLLQAGDDLVVSVTNSNLALIRETRQIDLKKGNHLFDLVDIPSRIDPSSVQISSPDGAFTVLEQNYEYDLVGVDQMLNKSLNHSIRVIHPDLGEHQGQLLSVSEQYLMLLGDDGQMQILPRSDELKILLNDFQQTQFRTQPTLVWQVDAQKSGSRPARISYLTEGLSWRADYSGTLNEDETRLTLSSWVTVENKSGRAYKDARLKLMAGDLNIVRKQSNRHYANLDVVLSKAAESSFKEKAFFEYHLYSLQRKTTLAQNQVKQIQLFPEVNSKISKRYTVESSQAKKVIVTVLLKNSKQNNLGMAIPAGKMRLYKADGQDMEFIGEDMVEHTAEDEELKIKVGQAFDIVSEREVIKTERPTKNKRRQQVEFHLRNHKKTPVTVRVVEQISGYQQSKLISSSVPPTKERASELVFDVPLDAKQSSTLKIEYEQSW